MTLAEIARLAVAGAYSGVLGWAAFTDVRSRRIPNWCVIAVIGLFGVWALSVGGANVVSALEAAGIAFVVSFGLYSFKIMGAGDSKLFTAVALFAGMGYLPLLVVATTLTGGAIALVILASQPTRTLVVLQTLGKREVSRSVMNRGVPYGLAIAIGGLIVVWAPMTDLVRPFAAKPRVTSADIRRTILEVPKPR
jgi:prepilin peptidase CpaA